MDKREAWQWLTGTRTVRDEILDAWHASGGGEHEPIPPGVLVLVKQADAAMMQQAAAHLHGYAASVAESVAEVHRVQMDNDASEVDALRRSLAAVTARENEALGELQVVREHLRQAEANLERHLGPEGTDAWEARAIACDIDRSGITAERDEALQALARRCLRDEAGRTLAVVYCPRTDAHHGHRFSRVEGENTPTAITYWCDGLNEDGSRPYAGL